MPHSSPVASSLRFNTRPLKVHPPVFKAAVAVLELIFLRDSLADQALEQVFDREKKLGSRDRKQAADWAYGVLRDLYRLQALCGLPPHQPADKEELAQLLRQLLDADCNLLEPKDSPFWISASLPQWLDELGELDLGVESWHTVINALNQPAPAFIRVNRLKTNPAALSRMLSEESGISTDTVPELPWALKLNDRKNLFRTSAFQAGFFEMQDGSSQLACDWVNAQPGQTVIDACAGAGGKTLALAASMQNKGSLIALDVSASRLDQARRRATRAGVSNLEIRLIEGTKTIKRLHGRADKVLLDVPCTGLGVLRRNPDRKWKIKPDELPRLVQLQADILQHYSQMVKPGGRLVYSTCSILRAENEDQVAKFLDRTPDFKQLRERRISPGENGWDGFFVAEFIRS